MKSVDQIRLQSNAYRYGFNGMEKDDVVKGNGNSYDFGARIYDPRLGRWLSIDPLQAKYPMMTPYCFVGDSPVLCVDPDGKEIYITNPETGEAHLYVPNATAISESAGEFVNTVAQTLDNLASSGKDVNGIINTLTTDDSYSNITKANWDSHFGNLAGTIKWNPEGGIVTDEGGRQSPDIALLHELAHTFYWKYDPLGKLAEIPNISDFETEEEWMEAMDEYDRQEEEDTGDYDGYNDKWVIEKVETPAAKKSGQSERNSHHYKKKYRAETPSSVTGQEQSEED